MQFYVGGVLTDPDGQVATVKVTKADGTVLYPAGTATARQSVGVYRKVLTPADLAELSLLTAVWSATFSGAADQVTTYAEVVGDHLFTLAAARAFNPRSQPTPPLQSTTSYPDDALLEARNRISDEFELVCGTSFFPRYRREVLTGSDLSGRGWVYSLSLGRAPVSRVLSVTVLFPGQAAVAYSAGDLATVVPVGGQLAKTSGAPWEAGRQNLVVEYAYGLDRVPGTVTRAALLLLTSQLVGTDVSPRALTIADETGTMTLATPGLRGAWYGLPEVDATLKRFRGKHRGVA